MAVNKAKLHKLMQKRSINIPERVESLIDLITLADMSNMPFKKPVEERAKRVGKIRYIGYKNNFYKKEGKIVRYIAYFFLVQGKKHELKKKKLNYRNEYLIIIEMPYVRNVKNMKRIYNLPVKIFASDPSFIFFGDAWILYNNYKAFYIDNQTIKWAHYAITHPPLKRNPNFIPYLTKHAFKLIFKFLLNKKPKELLKKQEIKNYKIPQWTYPPKKK